MLKLNEEKKYHLSSVDAFAPEFMNVLRSFFFLVAETHVMTNDVKIRNAVL